MRQGAESSLRILDKRDFGIFIDTNVFVYGTACSLDKCKDGRSERSADLRNERFQTLCRRYTSAEGKSALTHLPGIDPKKLSRLSYAMTITQG